MESRLDRGNAAGASGRSAGVMKHVVLFVRRYWWLIMLAALGAHLLAWIAANPQSQRVRWIFATTNTPLGVVIAVSVVFGAVMALLIRFQRHAGLKSSSSGGHRSEATGHGIEGADRHG